MDLRIWTRIALSELYGSLGLAMTFKGFPAHSELFLRMRSTETRRSRKSECLTPIDPEPLPPYDVFYGVEGGVV